MGDDNDARHGRGALEDAGCGCAGQAGAGLSSFTPAAPKPLDAQEALDLLKRGNADFVADRQVPVPVDHARRLELMKGQAPFAVLVGCSDSRVGPEHLFGRGLGELFIVRVAGNTVDQTALGSIQYAVSSFGCQLVVVMGHEHCGAVEAAVRVVEEDARYPGSIGRMIAPIIPAVLRAKRRGGDLLATAIRENVLRVVEQLTSEDPILLDPARGTVTVVGAVYSLSTGVVEFIT